MYDVSPGSGAGAEVRKKTEKIVHATAAKPIQLFNGAYVCAQQDREWQERGK